MKNLIYILIFLPSLLFSQETKNMELVGVRNITVSANSYDERLINFSVDSGKIFKINSLSHSDITDIGNTQKILLNNEVIFIIRADHSYPISFQSSFPIYLESGEHSLEVGGNWNNSYPNTATLYGLEFKLTTP